MVLEGCILIALHWQKSIIYSGNIRNEEAIDYGPSFAACECLRRFSYCWNRHGWIIAGSILSVLSRDLISRTCGDDSTS